MSRFHPDWLRPDWPAPAHVHAAFTTRAGGVSAAPFDSMNLGDHVNDAPAAVQANREVLRQALATEPVFLQQVHGSRVAVVEQTPAAGATPVVADASLTGRRGITCAVMVADCLPVLFTDQRGTAVAAAHAGWRGLAGEDGQGVLEAAVASLGEHSGAAAHDIMAWLGPCIGPESFEVGDEVREAFVAQQAAAASLFRPHGPGKWMADLAGLARLRLRTLGFDDRHVHGNDSSVAWCTVRNPSRFFSYRRERLTGRMAACIWLA